MSATASVSCRRDGRCAVCDGTSHRIVLRENGYEGRACSCGTIYITPEPQPHEVDHKFVGHSDAFYDLSAKLKAGWIRRHTDGENLLEIGCGTGAFLEAARNVGFRVEGIEADSTRAASAAQRLNTRVRPTFFEEAEIDHHFDVVYHCDMLAHFERPDEALQLMKRFLGPGGVLAFEVGFVADLPLFWYSWIGEIGYPQHRWLYSERSLRRLLDQGGLRIESIKVYDLSAYVAFQYALRTAVRLGRSARPRQPSGTALPSQPRATPSSGVLVNLRKFLRYGIGAILPRLGPSTALVVARPIQR